MRFVVVGLLLTGCAKEREEAPADLNRMLMDGFREYEVALVVDDHASALSTWLADDADPDATWEGLRVDNLGRAEVDGIDIPPNTDLSDHRGVATAFRSAFGPRAHAELAGEEDQTWTDPNGFVRYQRTIVDGDLGAFVGGEGVLRTNNEIERAGAFGISIPYTLRKDYQWVDLASGESALVVRWWLSENGCSDNGKNCVLQSFGFELLTPKDGGAQRLLVNWVEVVTEADAFMSEDARIGLIASGNQDLLLATDEFLAQ